METLFTPFASFGGGITIGLGAVLLMLGLGKIMGATGILSGLLFAESRSERSWRVMMVIGMVLAPVVLYSVTGSIPTVEISASPIMIVIGGILVGLGASMGSGCTSGHGICGLSRLSVRSIVAVPTFMITTGITVYVIRHGLGG